MNDENFLLDTEGGTRRWFTLKLKQIDHKALRDKPEAWFVELYRQAYAIYEADHTAYRFTPEERELMQAENKQHEVTVPGEMEILELLDWNDNPDNWKWIAPSVLKEHLKLNLSAVQIGKALKRIAEVNPLVKISRKTYSKIYFLPRTKSFYTHEEKPDDDIEVLPVVESKEQQIGRAHV